VSGGTNTVSQTLPDWLQPYLTSELSTAGSLSGAALANPQSMVAPLSPLQQSGLSSVSAVSPAAQSDANSALSANQLETSGALLNPASNPYLQNTFNLAAGSVENNLDSQFASSGSNVINSVPVQENELNNLATQLYGGQYDVDLNAMTQATALSPSVTQAAYLPGQEQLATGATQQQQAQNLINAPYNALSWYSGLLGWNGSSLGGSSSSNNPNAATQDAGLGISAVAAAAELASLFSACDRRLKTDIEHIGMLRSGLPIYRFRYRADPTRFHVGVMAEEAEKKFPEAVLEHDGYKFVDYSKIH
jgi:hypothetical protein